MFAVRVTGTGQTTNGRSNDKVAVENDVLTLSKGKVVIIRIGELPLILVWLGW